MTFRNGVSIGNSISKSVYPTYGNDTTFIFGFFLSSAMIVKSLVPSVLCLSGAIR